MTKKERENLLLNAWRLARHMERMERINMNEDYFSGLWRAQILLLRGFDIDFTKIQEASFKGMTFEEMKENL